MADEIFNWQATGQRALARHWQPLTPQQCGEFSALFADLVERSYIRKIEAYSGERIVYAGEVLEGDQATVKTTLITHGREGGRWRAYDVVIEGVSLIANYRTQFNKLIAQSGYDELMKRMKTKQDELGFEPGTPGTPKP